MPQLDSTGPDGKGSATGRGLGRCKKKDKKDWPLGKGMGKRRRIDQDGEGKGRRLKSGKLFDNDK